MTGIQAEIGRFHFLSHKYLATAELRHILSRCFTTKFEYLKKFNEDIKKAQNKPEPKSINTTHTHTHMTDRIKIPETVALIWDNNQSLMFSFLMYLCIQSKPNT